MKKLYSVKRVVHLSTALLFILILSVIYSCRKEVKIVPLSAADSVDAARSWYESTYPINNLIGVNNNLTTLGVNNNKGGQFDYSQNIKPDWNHTSKYKRFGKDVIEMPVDPNKVLYYGLKNNNTGQYTSAKENSRAWFLLLNDGKAYTAYVMVLIGDPNYINGDPSKLANNSYRKRDANFSGVLLYFTPKGKFISSFKYVNGSMVSPVTATGTSTQTQSVTKKTNEVANYDCIDWYEDEYQGDVLVASYYIGTTCDGSMPSGGGGGATPCQLTNAVTQKQVNVAVQDPGPGVCDGVDCDMGYPDPTQGSTCTELGISDTSKRVPGIPTALTQADSGSCVFMNMQIVGNILGVNVTEGGLVNNYAALTNQTPGYVWANGVPVDANFTLINSFISQYFNETRIGLSDVAENIYNGYPVMGFIINGVNPNTGLFDGHEVTIIGYTISNGVTSYQYIDTVTGTRQTTTGSNIGDLIVISKK